MNSTPKRILIVEDEPAHAEAIRRALETADPEGLDVRVVGTLREYHECVAADRPDIALMDLNLPDGRAVEVLTSPPEAGPFPVLIMASDGNEQIAVEALKSGALDYVVKTPESFTTMARTLTSALREWELIHDRRWAEEVRNATLGLLHICYKSNRLRELMQDLAFYFQELTGCEAIGVRLRQGEDFPYYETRGFSKEFVLAESRLCAYDQAGEMIRDKAGDPAYECMCGNIICGRFDPARSFFSQHGSFWSNNTTRLLATTTDADRQAKTRNRCNGEGYESVALIPLRLHNETFGLFQFNDRRTGRFSPEKIALLEELVDYVTIALAKLIADEALLETGQRLQLATAAGHLGIWDLDLKNNVLFWDDRMFEIYGVDRNAFSGCFEIWEKCWHPDDRAMILEERRAALSGEKTYDLEFRIVCPGGFVKWIKTNATVIRDAEDRPIRMIGLNQDITDRKRIEEQLRQTQKMEAIGTLAGGIAHDFNNILGSVFGYAEMALLDAKAGQANQEFLEEILKAARRAKDLVAQILILSRQSKQEKTIFEIHLVIKEALKLLRASLPSNILIKQNISAQKSTILGDPSQIHQVLLNLCVNAAHAMEENGGTLSIGLSDFILDAESSIRYVDLRPGSYLKLSVSDTGQGIGQNILDRIFEPFFTTKKAGKGTGMGLAIVHGIVKSHGGDISVASEPGRGTVFNILLPLTEEHVEQVARTDGVMPGGSERILFVDDEPGLVEAGQKLLGRLGYKVTGKTGSVEALETFLEHPENFDLVITDMTMPNMTGKGLGREMMRVRPEIPIILCTGFSEIMNEEKAAETGFKGFLMKPLDFTELAGLIRKVLGATG
ncbi:MAG: response regulator [Deltaproteobacteria bacterium]|nr:response regulator [Deltaproteobacteria bacterium]